MRSSMYNDLERVLFTREQLQQRIEELGNAITEDFASQPPIMVCILKGAVVFFSELLKNIALPVEIDVMAASSYEDRTGSSGMVRVVKDLSCNIVNKNIILVEDIIDSGRTLFHLRELLLSRGAASVTIATLLDKPSRRVLDLQPDYCGFTIPDVFVVGYGLDYAEKYRNLPEIGILSPSVIKA